MWKLLLPVLILLFTTANLLSQNRAEDFEISLPEIKISNSLYKTIHCIDSRHDTTYMGIVQLGAFNKKARVVPEIPFCVQLTNLVSALIDNSAKEGELLFQLRQLSFAEITGAMSEKGYCYLRASIYSKANNRYQKLNSIDTVILIKTMDVTRALFRNGSKTITDFISKSLLKSPADLNDYSFNDIINIDSIEKRKITVYNTAVLSDGLYENYQSFMNQVPDKKITVEMKKQNISQVKTIDQDGKSEKVKAKDIYAIVHNGQPYIATDYGYYPLQKTGDDFFFTGKAKVSANTGDVIAASFFFGIIGGLIASDAEAVFDMKLDHMNGGFIRLREIKPIPQ